MSNFRCLKGLILNYLENPTIPDDSIIHSQGAPDKPKFYRNRSHTVLILVAEEVRDWVQSANRVPALMIFISALFSHSLKTGFTTHKTMSRLETFYF